jgi:hypothetical protein
VHRPSSKVHILLTSQTSADRCKNGCSSALICLDPPWKAEKLGNTMTKLCLCRPTSHVRPPALGALPVWRLGEGQGLRDPLKPLHVCTEGLLTVLMLWVFARGRMVVWSLLDSTAHRREYALQKFYSSPATACHSAAAYMAALAMRDIAVVLPRSLLCMAMHAAWGGGGPGNKATREATLHICRSST